MATPTSQTARRWIVTASVTAITATGALYGAGLKTRKEYTQEKSAVLELSPAERIEQLELRKQKLVRQKNDLQVKIDKVAAKANATAENLGEQK